MMVAIEPVRRAGEPVGRLGDRQQPVAIPRAGVAEHLEVLQQFRGKHALKGGQLVEQRRKLVRRQLPYVIDVTGEFSKQRTHSSQRFVISMGATCHHIGLSEADAMRAASVASAVFVVLGHWCIVIEFIKGVRYLARRWPS